MRTLKSIALLLTFLIANSDASPKKHHYATNLRPCASRQLDGDSIVCVCSATYCDDLPIITPPSTTKTAQRHHHHGKTTTLQAGTTYWMYRSTRDGQRFNQSQGTFDTDVGDADVTLTIQNTTRQTILGFGGAFTDAAAINILNLSRPAQDNIITSYFSSNGIEYSIARIPMAGCDFSTHVYTYDDQPDDFQLTQFKLADEDVNMKIPLLLRAKWNAVHPIRYFASPWSAPGWMKTNGNAGHAGVLKGQPGGQYYKAWAQYFIRFIQAYEAQNISIWGLTAQNEPTDGYIPKFPFNSMGFTPSSQRDFIAKDLGPALSDAGLRRVKLMIMDDQRYLLPGWADTVLMKSDKETKSAAADYVDGIGVHWYMDKVTPASFLSKTHERHPDKFILATEACEGSLPWQKKVILGDWSRAESYATDIIEDLQNWVNGWTDWNIALNEQGGPNWAGNHVDSPVIVNATGNEFYKQPMFYSLGHFSKFITPDSTILTSSLSGNAALLQVIAAQRPDKGVTVVVVNKGSKDATLKVVDQRLMRGELMITVPARSIQSLVWW